MLILLEDTSVVAVDVGAKTPDHLTPLVAQEVPAP
jgi:hypothetical protein